MKNGHEMFHHAGSSSRFPNRRSMPVPALPPYLIEPIFEQFRALLPERKTNHPLGCHRSRIAERVVFDKLVQVLVFGCAYERMPTHPARRARCVAGGMSGSSLG
jgi:hypothetical protein